MIIGLVLLAIIGLITTFSIQNAIPISISLIKWRFDTTLPILTVISVLLGVLVEQLVRSWARKRSTKEDKL